MVHFHRRHRHVTHRILCWVHPVASHAVSCSNGVRNKNRRKNKRTFNKTPVASSPSAEIDFQIDFQSVTVSRILLACLGCVSSLKLWGCIWTDSMTFLLGNNHVSPDVHGSDWSQQFRFRFRFVVCWHVRDHFAPTLPCTEFSKTAFDRERRQHSLNIATPAWFCFNNETI